MYLSSHSYYSLRYGTISVDNLVEEAARCGVKALALTDINNSTGIMDFVAASRVKGIQPIAGIEFRQGDEYLYTGLAKSNEGFRELNEFLSFHNLNNQPFPVRAPELDQVFWIYPFPGGETAKWRNGETAKWRNGETAKWRNGENRQPSTLDRQSWIGIRPSELSPLMLSRHRDLIPRMVLMAPVTFRNRQEYELHCNFRAVDHNVLLSRLGPGQVAPPDEIMQPVGQLLDTCRDFPEITRNTEKIMADCSIDFDFKSCKNKKTYTGERYDDLILLEKLAMDGLQYRYGKGHAEARRRIRHELE
ncbi:MAG: PHP domain-containing protein, partial [Bacteroidota bacterium]